MIVPSRKIHRLSCLEDIPWFCSRNYNFTRFWLSFAPFPSVGHESIFKKDLYFWLKVKSLTTPVSQSQSNSQLCSSYRHLTDSLDSNHANVSHPTHSNRYVRWIIALVRTNASSVSDALFHCSDHKMNYVLSGYSQAKKSLLCIAEWEKSNQPKRKFLHNLAFLVTSFWTRARILRVAKLRPLHHHHDHQPLHHQPPSGWRGIVSIFS